MTSASQFPIFVVSPSLAGIPSRGNISSLEAYGSSDKEISTRKWHRVASKVPSASRVMPGALSSTHCKKFWRDDEDEVERLGDTTRMKAPLVSRWPLNDG